MKQALTPANARTAEPGTVLVCAKVKGLTLVVRQKVKSWTLYYRTKDGRERRPKFGTFPELTVDSARATARELLQDVAKGNDPSLAWKTGRTSPTVSKLCDLYIAHWLPRKVEAARIEDTRKIETMIRPVLGKMRVDEVTIDDVEKFLENVYKRKYQKAAGNSYSTATVTPVVANHTRAILSKMFNLARQRWDMLPANKPNPVEGARRYARRKRKRVAKPHELQAIHAAMEARRAAYPLHWACVMVIFFTGARVNEIKGAKHRQREGGVIRLAEHKTAEKTEEDRVIILPAPALAALDSIPPDPSGFIFGTAALKKFWNGVRTEAGCPDLQMLDARRTFASMAQSLGYSKDDMGAVFNHADPSTTDHYAWLFDDVKVEIADKTAAAIEHSMKTGKLPALRGGGESDRLVEWVRNNPEEAVAAMQASAAKEIDL